LCSIFSEQKHHLLSLSILKVQHAHIHRFDFRLNVWEPNDAEVKGVLTRLLIHIRS